MRAHSLEGGLVKKLLPALVAALLVAPQLSQPAGAATKKTFYEGTTSQGFPWQARLVHLPTGQLALSALAIELTIDCPSGFSQTGGGIIGNLIPDPLDPNRTWTYSDMSSGGGLNADVTFGTPAATGSVSVDFPGLDPQGQPEFCSTGDIALTGTRLRGGSISFGAPQKGERFSFRMTRSSGGALTTHLSSQASRTEVRYVRLYRGKSDQGGPVEFETLEGAKASRLDAFLQSYRVVCDDSSVQDWFVFYGFLPGILMQGRRFSFSDDSEFARVDVEGRLGARVGSGTTSFSFAQFTLPDETPELCTSSTFGWSVGRSRQKVVKRRVRQGWRYERI